MKKKNKELNLDEIKHIGKSVIGKSFKELGLYEEIINSHNKGSLGQFIEEHVFNFDNNSSSEPDFKEAGVELKVTPYKKNKNGTYSAKERLVLNIINYMEEYKNDFYTSSFWQKNKRLYIMFYQHEEDKEKVDFVLTHELLYDYPEEDLIIIMNDWEIIKTKIIQGKAHEISEADTLYLGACTKGTSSSTMRQQPFSDILAKQRAYSLKTSYMTQLLRNQVLGRKYEQIASPEELKYKKFEEVIQDKISLYIGKTQSELCNLFDVKSKSKGLNVILLGKMLNIKGRLSTSSEFLKANIVPKTIRVEENDRIIESMSFPAFRFNEIILEEWESSTLRIMFETTKFLFVIFKRIGKEYVFKGIKFWNMPVSVLDNEVYKVWEKTIKVILDGNIVKSISKSGNRQTNFPGMKSNSVAHVRPHGRNKDDVYPLPVPDKLTGLRTYTKHCFWLNNKYIEKIIHDN